MNKKKWIQIWFYIIMLIPVVGTFNYLVDPYGINNFLTIDRVNTYKKSNTHFTFRVKTDVVSNNNFDTLMLGTSRIGVMDPTIVNKSLGGKTFNFDAPGSTTDIQHKLFLYTLKFNKIKYLIYGIDFMSFNEQRSIEKNFKSFNELKNKIENQKKIYHFDLYFNLDTFYDSINVLQQNIMQKKLMDVRYSTKNGMREYDHFIAALDNKTLDLNKTFKRSLKAYFSPEVGIYKKYKFSESYLDYFKKTINYCKSNNIKVWVYIPPMHSKHFKMIRKKGYFDEFENFKKELVKVTNYIDFTGNNEFTTNTNNYWDTSHLRKETTSIIMENIFNHDNLTNSPKIGSFVHKGNIQNHLKSLRESLEKRVMSQICITSKYPSQTQPY